jgi:thioredoxin-dependent peroxiredoxin
MLSPYNLSKKDFFMLKPTLNIGDRAPDFSLPTQLGHVFNLGAHLGQPVVVYFYPKDDTPGCTAQACDLRDNMGSLQAQGVSVIGISKDSVAKHQKFAEKFNLNFALGADETGHVLEAYGVWVEKSMYGKKYMGIERSTFLIDKTGCISHIWRNVKVPGHVAEIKKALA